MRQKFYQWYGKRTVQVIVGVIALLLIVVAVRQLISDDTAPESVETSTSAVRTDTVRSLSTVRETTLIGDITSIDAARIESETSGRIVRVNVALGEQVSAGTVIAELENASERAAVLQAEGTYEAAVAAGAQSDSSARSAETTLTSERASGLNTYQSALNTADDVVRNTLDDLYSDPTGQISGFKLNALGNANELNDRRQTVEAILDTWAETTREELFPVDADELLTHARRDLLVIAELVERIVYVAANEKNNGAVVDGVSIGTIRDNLTTARSTINTTLQNVENSQTSLRNAEDALLRAQIAGSGGGVSAADAQVKQALGALRAAQANLAKTIIRTPISGTVNSVAVKTGDFIGSFEPIATVANNDALEITTYVSRTLRDHIASGDHVEIEGGHTGVVTQVAPALDPATQKIEVKIQTESPELANGDTVRLSIRSTDRAQSVDRIVVPITALKVGTEETVVFTIDANNALVPHTVETGPLLGSNIIIESGLTLDMDIVLDARGLNAGDIVTRLEQ